MNIENILEINHIKEKCSEYCYTEEAKEQVLRLVPFLKEIDVKVALRETSEAKQIIEAYGNPPLTAIEAMTEYLQIAQIGGCLSPEQLEHIASILTCVRRLQDYLERAKRLTVGLAYFADNLNPMEDVREEILRIIRNGKVDDFASKVLRDCRNEIERLESKIREKADNLIRSQKACMSEQFTTMRNGHICLPVKKDCKSKIPGVVIDKSSTGSTLFIEPSVISSLSEELNMVKLEEENEEKRILYTLTAMLSDSEEIFRENQRVMEKLDFIFAKAKLSIEVEGTEPIITTERFIQIEDGRHPLMDKSICVPLQFQMDSNVQGVIITGPNTGGKTVAIKTVGINSYMAQCGLHVSCKKATFCMNNQVLCDIGDHQNLSENLSTFSAHITHILDILQKANRESLVILDELGSGTDPTEGMGIAIAILEELRKSGCMFLVTTHYPEVKQYGEQAIGVVNARMAFDKDSLKPLYQLELGKSGESCAFYIAQKLGMSKEMLMCASKAAYGNIPEFISQMEQDKRIKRNTGKIEKQKKQSGKQVDAMKYQLGDSVMIYPDHKIGIVCKVADDQGVLKVQLKNKKIFINHKRVKLLVKATELYPADYDFSIVFDSVEVRKTRHLMERKYVEDIEIHMNEENT